MWCAQRREYDRSSFMCDELGVDRDLWCRIWGSYLAENEYSLGITLDSIPRKAVSTGVRESTCPRAGT